MLRSRPLAAALVLVAVVAGCSDEDDQTTGEPDTPSAEIEATLDRVVESSDPAAVCDILSPRQLTETAGKIDPLTRCREVAERRGEGNPLKSYAVVEVEDGCARVDVDDQRGTEAVFFMRETDGRWLVDNIEVPPISSEVNLCGRVRLFGEGQ